MTIKVFFLFFSKFGKSTFPHLTKSDGRIVVVNLTLLISNRGHKDYTK